MMIPNRHGLGEIQLLGSVLPNCIITGFLMLLFVKLMDTDTDTQSHILISLWTYLVLYAFTAVFVWRYIKMFPVFFQNVRDTVCCCIPYSHSSLSRSQSQSQSAAMPHSNNDNVYDIETATTTIVTKMNNKGTYNDNDVHHISSEEASPSPDRSVSSLSHSLSDAKTNMMSLAMTTLAKRIMEKDAIIAEKDARIMRLEAQLAQIYHNNDNDNDNDNQ